MSDRVQRKRMGWMMPSADRRPCEREPLPSLAPKPDPHVHRSEQGDDHVQREQRAPPRARAGAGGGEHRVLGPCRPASELSPPAASPLG